jgi:DNA modification methylase
MNFQGLDFDPMNPEETMPNGNSDLNMQLIKKDVFLGLKDIPNNSVDLIVTDPPYGINLTKGYKKGSEELVSGDDGFTVMVFVDELMREFQRILKPNSAMYIFTRFDVFPYWWLKTKNYFETKNQIIWSKGGGGVGDLKGNYIYNYESIIYATNGKHQLRGKREGSVWEIPKCKLEYHETEKPVKLIEKIINKSSDKGMTVFDPFMGSGTTAIASLMQDRNFIGFELLDKYYETALKRVEEKRKEKDLQARTLFENEM